MASPTTHSSRNTRKGRRKARTGITYRGQRTTHQTKNLPGFPAVDIFAKPGTAFLAPENGRVVRLSGSGGTSGQTYGYSVYFVGVSGRVYYIQHLNYARAKIGSYQQGDVLGTVSPWTGGSPHAHVGINDSGYNPGSGDTSAAPTGGTEMPQMPTPNAPELPQAAASLGPPGAPPPNSPPMPGLPGETPGLPTDDISEQWRRLAQQPLASPETRRWAGIE